jgi:hypothetical protein
MFYDAMMATEISRLVQQERLAEARNYRLLHELELANGLEIKGSPLRQMRKMMNRVMSLFF